MPATELDKALLEIRLHAGFVRFQLRNDLARTMQQLANDLGLGEWYREHLDREAFRLELRRELAARSYFGYYAINRPENASWITGPVS